MELEAETLLWCLLPDFDLHIKRPRAEAVLRDRFRSAVLPERLRRFAPSQHNEFGDALVITRAENERRVLNPIVENELIPLAMPWLSNRAGGASGQPAVKTVKSWIDSTLARIDRLDLRERWREAANATQHHLMAYSRIELARYRYVLVARQSHSFVRALIAAASVQGVPTSLIPHSPLTRWQVDLPVAHAGLRGSAERAYVVAKTGAESARINVVGNPATSLLGTPFAPLDRVRPGVLALSPDPEEELAQIIALVRESGQRELVVAPHPRSDIAMLRRLLPNEWEVYQGSHTLDLLRAGTPWLLQCSSGVAWEAAALGIPTADIRLGGRHPDYPLLESAIFTPVATPGDVRDFVSAALSADRGLLRAHARSWCEFDGNEAVRLARDFLSRISPSEPTAPIADAWAPGGVLREGSILTASDMVN